MNKEELRVELIRLRSLEGNYNDYPVDSRKRLSAIGKFEGINEALKLAEKLDEPETTEEQAWQVIGSKEEVVNFDAEMFYKDMRKVFKESNLIEPVSNLSMQYTLVPKSRLIEPEIPVIPQFVAEYIDSARRENATLLGAMDHFLNSKEIKSWMRVNQELFAKAWLSKDGYTIEPQPIKTRQVLVKFFDNEEYRTELTEDAARELIEFLEANKHE